MIEINTLTVFLLSFTTLYIFSAFYLIMQHHPKVVNNSQKYKISILLAVRNEEKYLKMCLQALANQDYNTSLYDVFILDDNSNDNSAAIAKDFCGSHHNFHYMLIKEQQSGLKGKMNVLAQGLIRQNCDLVLITDADCLVPTSWISGITAYFDEKTGLVGALTSLTPLSDMNLTYKEKLFHKIQALDWLFLQAVARLSSNAGKPVTVLGNNFAFSLKAYRETGGFEKIGFSITEDYALLKAIEKTGRWEIKHINDPRAAIFSYPLDSLKDFFMQRLRWIKGGRSARPWAYFLMSTSFVTHILLLIALITNPGNILNLLALISIFLMDYQTVKSNIKKVKSNQLKPLFILFELFYMIYTLLFSVYFLFPVKIGWKGRKL